MNSGGFTDIDQANALADTALSAVRQIVDGAFWKLLPDDQLDFGRRLEVIARTVYAAQVHQAGEIDTQGIAADRSCSSTAALLRQALVISVADAKARVAAARQILPRLMPTGAEAPPILPELAQAVDHGCVGPEHIKIIVETMAKVPAKVIPAARELCEQTLVDTAIDCDPNFLGHAAQRILDRVDPDGDIDDTTPASKMELHFGTRSTRTGLTPIKGQLDDHGVEVVKKAIDGLAAPRPEQDGVRDLRPGRPERAGPGGSDAQVPGPRRCPRTGPGTPARHHRDELGRHHRAELGREFRHRGEDQPRAGPQIPVRRADHPDDPRLQVRNPGRRKGVPHVPCAYPAGVGCPGPWVCVAGL